MKKICKAFSLCGARTRLVSVFLSLLIVYSFLFVSCGAKMSYEGRDDAFSAETYAAMDMYNEVLYDKVESESGAMVPNVSTGTAFPTNRKIIKNVSIGAETKAFDAALLEIESLVTASGGYIQSSNVYGNSIINYEKVSSRRANFVLRIPAEKLDGFLGEVGELINIISNTSNVDDITDSYADIEARLNSLKTSETRLLELLAKAGNLEDVILLENKLSDIRYQIESHTATLKNYDTLVAYSTVSISISEVLDYTEQPVVNPTFGERVSKAFSESWGNFADGAKNFAIGFVYSLPTLITLVVVMSAILLVVVLSVRSSRRKRCARFEHTDENK